MELVREAVLCKVQRKVPDEDADLDICHIKQVLQEADASTFTDEVCDEWVTNDVCNTLYAEAMLQKEINEWFEMVDQFVRSGHPKKRRKGTTPAL